MEEMPPRRMGSMRVVVVFSSRLNFSGGPEPPSPAARLLPGPDMAATARRGAASPEGRQAGGGGASVTCRGQRAEMWTRPVLRGPILPHTHLLNPAPTGPGPLTGCEFNPAPPSSISPDITGLPQHRAQAQVPKAVPDVAELHFMFLLVALCPASRVRFGFFQNTSSSSP